MKKIALLLFGILAVTGCNKDSSSAASKKRECKTALKINIGQEPGTLDPRRARSLGDINLIKMFFEGLTRADADGKASLAAAKSYELSEDGRLYTFQLRNTSWSNGEGLTADDFVYAWKKALSPNFPCDQAAQLYPIKNAKSIKEGKLPMSFLGVKALDSKTLAIKLENPTPYFLDLLAAPIYFPVNAKVDRVNPNWSQNSQSFICNGPFVLSEWRHHNQMIAEKNSRYWDEKAVQMAKIEMSMVDEKTGFSMFENRELHWEGSPHSTIPTDAITTLRESKNLRVKPFLGTYWIRTNTEVAPFNHPNFRKAFSLAINREAIIEHVTQGNQIVATGIVPDSMGLQETPLFTDHDIERARELFQQAKEELGLSELPEIRLSYSNSDRNHRIAQAIQEQWNEALGVRIALESVESKVYFDRVRKQDYQLACGSWIADYNDPINFLEVFASKENGTNNTGWSNEEFASQLEETYTLQNKEERK
ncbi:MAG: peptide ABC transporter substrate-binding protein [Candidatus Algichlamydia australiensis]|nr:peptide ABC transporter substrate-binding protein [Chlamydiales bacterium]